MSRKWTQAILAVNFMALALIGAYLFIKPAQPPSLPAEGTTKPAPQLEFKRYALFESDMVIIDDGEPQPLACKSDTEPVLIVPLDAQTKGFITCSEDYMGGVKLHYPGSGANEVLSIGLGQRDADAGDVWDTRSLIYRANYGRLVIESITLQSSENIEDVQQPAACSVRQEALIWSPESRGFAVGNRNPEFFLSRFTSRINVVNDCLDERGQWRGSSAKDF